MPKQTYDYHGWVDRVGQTKTFGQNGFTKRELILTDRDGKYQQFICFEFVKDNCGKLDKLVEGDEVVVSYNLRGRIHEGRCYTSLNGVDVQVVALSRPAEQPADPLPPEREQNVDDPPF